MRKLQNQSRTTSSEQNCTSFWGQPSNFNAPASHQRGRGRVRVHRKAVRSVSTTILLFLVGTYQYGCHMKPWVQLEKIIKSEERTPTSPTLPNSTALCSGRDAHQNPCVESCRLVGDRCPPRTTSSLLRFCETERCVKLRDVPACCSFHCVLSMVCGFIYARASDAEKLCPGAVRACGQSRACDVCHGGGRASPCNAQAELIAER